MTKKYEKIEKISKILNLITELFLRDMKKRTAGNESPVIQLQKMRTISQSFTLKIDVKVEQYFVFFKKVRFVPTL